ncbi:hypothetical protein ACFU9Y_28045 [Streptomyces sp. NPDC057621]|uniref:Lipoprotein n=1 Tax=Streptomyces liliiviolaceus TaxID=2823109 RepID=A0A940XNA8_9ACTN|nr:hypothetical protein [Streptomyces liliiviolaceus]MBQ0847397.1 hypothetical protein [Streptomyces liliiviolaceus]
MRIRATVAAVTGALALSAFAVPVAQADDSSYRETAAAAFDAAHSGASKAQRSKAAAAVDGDLDASFSNFKIASVHKVGTTNQVSTKVTYKLTHGADVDLGSLDFATGPYIYKGSFATPDNVIFGFDAATCTETSATVANCTGYVDILPAEGELLNSDAGSWKGGALLLNYNTGSYADQGDLGTTKVLRNSRLTVNASPEPVKKGKTITVTGALTRANWETNKYAGYTQQSVKLQFKKKGSSTYTNVKTVKSGSGSSAGKLKTTVTASVDGTFRYAFAGTSTTPAVNSAGDFVDVK